MCKTVCSNKGSVLVICFYSGYIELVLVHYVGVNPSMVGNEVKFIYNVTF